MSKNNPEIQYYLHSGDAFPAISPKTLLLNFLLAAIWRGFFSRNKWKSPYFGALELQYG